MATRFADLTHEGRNDQRHAVHYRLRLKRGHTDYFTATIVNLSVQGFMARCDHDVMVGDRLSVTLPGNGIFEAEVRWALGGRIGCRLDRPVPIASFYAMLAAMADRI